MEIACNIQKAAISRKRLTVHQKYNILKACIAGEKRADLAAKYGIAVNTISVLMKQKDRIFTEVELHFNRVDSKSLKTTAHPFTDEALYSWFLQTAASNVPITGAMLLEKANEFVALERGPDFKVSRGFVDKWKHRHGVSKETAPLVAEQFINFYSKAPVYQTDKKRHVPKEILSRVDTDADQKEVKIAIKEICEDVETPPKPTKSEVSNALEVIERLGFHITPTHSSTFKQSLKHIKQAIKCDELESLV